VGSLFLNYPLYEPRLEEREERGAAVQSVNFLFRQFYNIAIRQMIL